MNHPTVRLGFHLLEILLFFFFFLSASLLLWNSSGIQVSLSVWWVDECIFIAPIPFWYYDNEVSQCMKCRFQIPFLITKFKRGREVTFMWNTATYNIGWYVVQPVNVGFGFFQYTCSKENKCLSRNTQEIFFRQPVLKWVQILREHSSNTLVISLTQSTFK